MSELHTLKRFRVLWNNGEQQRKAFTIATRNRDQLQWCLLAGYHFNC